MGWHPGSVPCSAQELHGGLYANPRGAPALVGGSLKLLALKVAACGLEGVEGGGGSEDDDAGAWHGIRDPFSAQLNTGGALHSGLEGP